MTPRSTMAISPARMALIRAEQKQYRRKRIAVEVARYSPADGAVNCPPLRDLPRPIDRAATARHYWIAALRMLRRNSPDMTWSRVNALFVAALAERRRLYPRAARVNSMAAG